VGEEYESIIVDRPRPGIMTVTLNRPAALNAINAELVQAVHEVLTRVRHDSSVRAIVLTGSGRAFCAGLDLRGYGDPPGVSEDEGPVQSGLRLQQHVAELVDSLRFVRAPIIVAVNGPAAGAGMSLALLADIRLMSASATFHASFIRRGLSSADIDTSWLLPRLIGFSRAAQIMLTGRVIDAEEAKRIGLVSSVEPDGELVSGALDLAGSIVEHSPFGVWMTKEVMWSNLEVSGLRAAIDLENRTQILSSLTADHREAVEAFLENRPAEVRNR
jgi:enoyl-CoA hydratase